MSIEISIVALRGKHDKFFKTISKNELDKSTFNKSVNYITSFVSNQLDAIDFKKVDKIIIELAEEERDLQYTFLYSGNDILVFSTKFNFEKYIALDSLDKEYIIVCLIEKALIELNLDVSDELFKILEKIKQEGIVRNYLVGKELVEEKFSAQLGYEHKESNAEVYILFRDLVNESEKRILVTSTNPHDYYINAVLGVISWGNELSVELRSNNGENFKINNPFL